MINRYAFTDSLKPVNVKLYRSKYHKTSIIIYAFMILGFNLMYIFLTNWIGKVNAEAHRPDYLIYSFVYIYNIVLFSFLIKSFVYYRMSRSNIIFKQSAKDIQEVLSQINCENCSQTKQDLFVLFRKNGDLEICCETCKNVVLEITENQK